MVTSGQRRKARERKEIYLSTGLRVSRARWQKAILPAIPGAGNHECRCEPEPDSGQVELRQKQPSGPAHWQGGDGEAAHSTTLGQPESKATGAPPSAWYCLSWEIRESHRGRLARPQSRGQAQSMARLWPGPPGTFPSCKHFPEIAGPKSLAHHLVQSEPILVLTWLFSAPCPHPSASDMPQGKPMGTASSPNPPPLLVKPLNPAPKGPPLAAGLQILPTQAPLCSPNTRLTGSLHLDG